MWCARATWALPVVVSTVLAVLLHVNTLGNDLVWDDRAAVMYNPDVTQQRPLRALWTNDFWGQDMALPDSHKSYRPLAVLSLRLNHAWGGLNPWGYHAVNLALHALATAAVALLAWTVADNNDYASSSTERGSGVKRSSGGATLSYSSLAARWRAWCLEPSRAWAAWTAGLFFAIHPVHVEPVASAVGRADLLCGSLALVALLTYLAASPELQHRVGPRSAAAVGHGSNARSSQSRSTGASIGWMWGHAAVAFGLALCATFSKELGVTTFGLFACHEVVEALVHDASAVAAAPILVTAPQPLSEQFQAAWFLTYAPIVRAIGTTVRWLMGRPHALYSSPSHLESSSSGAAVRMVAAFSAACGCILLHLSLHGKTALYSWTVLENHVALMPDKQSRVLTYAHVHARYAWKLLWPFGTLCYDHGHECLPTITTWHDPNNWAAFMLYTFMLLLGRHALAQPRQNALAAAAEVAAAEETAGAARSQSSSSPRLSRNTSNSSNGSICSGRLLLWGLALLVVPFVPASHVLFPIGTVLGERLLYLPSAGYALLLAHLVCVLLRCTATPQSQSASSFPDLPQKKAQIVEGTKEEKNMPASAHCRDMSPSHRLSKQQHRCCSSLVACASLMAIGGYGVALGNASWARNFDWATEIALFESAMNVCPRSLKVLNNLALRLMEGNAPQPQVRRASALLDTCLSIHPKFAQAQYNKGLAHFYLGEHLESLPYFETAVNLARYGPSGKEEAEEEGSSSGSDSIEEEGGGRDDRGDDPRARSCWARAYYRLGLELQDAAEVAGAGAGEGRKGGASREELRREAAVLFRRTLQVLAPLVTATREVGGDSGMASTGGVVVQPSSSSSGSDRPQPASARPVVQIQLSMPIAHLHAGLAWTELGDFESAQVQFQACLAANHARGGPDSSAANGEVFDVDAEAGVYNSLGNALRDLKRPQEALAAYQEGSIMASSPSSGGSGCFECLANAAGLRMDLGDVDGALMAYSTARQLAPHSAQVANNLGYLHERRGALGEAAQLYREALQLLGYPQQRHPQIETNLRLLEEKLGKLP